MCKCYNEVGKVKKYIEYEFWLNDSFYYDIFINMDAIHILNTG